MEVWAVGQAAAYHLHLPRLYGRTLPVRERGTPCLPRALRACVVAGCWRTECWCSCRKLPAPAAPVHLSRASARTAQLAKPWVPMAAGMRQRGRLCVKHVCERAALPETLRCSEVGARSLPGHVRAQECLWPPAGTCAHQSQPRAPARVCAAAQGGGRSLALHSRLRAALGSWGQSALPASLSAVSQRAGLPRVHLVSYTSGTNVASPEPRARGMTLIAIRDLMRCLAH